MPRTLLVIDIQNDYFPGGALPLWRAEETEARIVDAIGKGRAAGDRIVLVQHVSGKPEGLFASRAPGTAIRSGVLAAAGDTPIVTKHHADAFQDTDLSRHLETTEELLICGMMTQNCVVFTAMSDDARQFKRRVLVDLCTAPTETIHRIAVNAIGSKLATATLADAWG
ncbi:isochorismatase [Methylobacterium sp. Leaf113]|uniref:cysteine hydrolase family protein n=1 Tax=Methylobacterium sp. Leaf113 TaxID=1736259 RepID=UPI0006F92AE3|nr:isochorismatase family protein [Methylobacterium sp. Leaf113]KQP93788.1 isochorismatase [Methylobacterium sp. Leaf113]